MLEIFAIRVDNESLIWLTLCHWRLVTSSGAIMPICCSCRSTTIMRASSLLNWHNLMRWRVFLFWRIVAKHRVFEIAKSYNDHCDVVKWSSQKWVFKDVFYSHSAHFVYVLNLTFNARMILVIKYSFPYAVRNISIVHLIKDSITAKHNKIMLPLYLKWFNIRGMNNYAFSSTKSWYLCLRVAKCSGNRKSTWKNSKGPSKVELLILVHLFFVVCDYLICCSSVVYFTSGFPDSQDFVVIARLVVVAERKDSFAFVGWEHSSWVAYICYIADILNDDDHNGTGATLVFQFTRLRVVHLVKKSLLSLSESSMNGFLWILWKAALHNNVGVKVITKEIGAEASTVTIVDSEVWTSGPLVWIDVSSALGWKKVCDYRDAIFIIVTNKALVRVGSISPHNSCALVRSLSWIIVRDDDLVSRLNTNFVKFFFRGAPFCLNIAFTSRSHAKRLVGLLSLLRLNIGSRARPIKILCRRWSLTRTSSLRYLDFIHFWSWCILFFRCIINILEFKLSVLGDLNLSFSFVPRRVALKFVQENILTWWILAQVRSRFYASNRHLDILFFRAWRKIFFASFQLIMLWWLFWYGYLQISFADGADLWSYADF